MNKWKQVWDTQNSALLTTYTLSLGYDRVLCGRHWGQNCWQGQQGLSPHGTYSIVAVRCQTIYHRVINAVKSEELSDMNIYLFLSHLVSKINIMLICIFCLQFWVPSTVPNVFQPLTFNKCSINELNRDKLILKILRALLRQMKQRCWSYPLKKQKSPSIGS